MDTSIQSTNNKISLIEGFDSLYKSWLSTKSINTQRTYRASWNYINNDLPYLNITDFTQVDKWISKKLEIATAEGRDARRTIRLSVSVFLSFSSYAYKAIKRSNNIKLIQLFKLIQLALIDADKRPLSISLTEIKLSNRLKTMTPNQICTFVNSIKSHKTKILFLFLINTGMRISELLSLSFYKDGTKSNYIRLVEDDRYLISVIGKGNRPRSFKINKTASIQIKTLYIDNDIDMQSGQAVLSTRSGKRLQRAGALGWLKTASNKAGLKLALTCHLLRHVFISAHRQAGTDIHHLAETVGNSPEILSSTYDHSIVDVNSNFNLGV